MSIYRVERFVGEGASQCRAYNALIDEVFVRLRAVVLAEGIPGLVSKLFEAGLWYACWFGAVVSNCSLPELTTAECLRA
jgi:hypothetical protein